MFKHIPILVSMFSKFPGTTTNTCFTAQMWYVHGTYCIDLLLISGWWFQRCYAPCWRGGDTNNIFAWNILKLGILLGRGVLAAQECINIAGNKSSDSRGFAKGLNAKAKLISALSTTGLPVAYWNSVRSRDTRWLENNHLSEVSRNWSWFVSRENADTVKTRKGCRQKQLSWSLIAECCHICMGSRWLKPMPSEMFVGLCLPIWL